MNLYVFRQGSDPRVFLFAMLPISYRQALSKYTPVRCRVVSTATPTLSNHHITGAFDIIRIVTKDNYYSVGHLSISIRVSRKCFWLLRDNIQPYFRLSPRGLSDFIFIYTPLAWSLQRRAYTSNPYHNGRSSNSVYHSCSSLYSTVMS